MRLVSALILGATLVGTPAVAGELHPRVTHTSAVPFGTVAEALRKAVTDAGMGLVCHANAQAAAAARGVKIRGNQVLMVFRNDFAVRIFAANVAAGFEAPIRLYLYENADGTTTLEYVKPSDLFRPYGHPDLNAIGAELDPIFARIVQAALGS